MTDLRDVLDEQISLLSQMSEDDLSGLLHMMERAYIHALIEQGLRGVSNT